jgi:glycosyltransferase involved in cell wall biosynthesis
VRVALVSPYPPLSSGIADYAAELAPELAAAGAEMTLVHEGRVPPVGEVLARWPALPVRELAAHRDDFDAVLYQLGNSAPHHAEIYRALLAIPGVVVLHEFMLHHLIRALTLDAGRPEEYVEEMRYCAGETGRRAARALLDTHRPVDPWRFPLLERVVDRSRGVLVHSDFARRRVLASRPEARVGVVPFPVDLERGAAPAKGARERARAELGVSAETFLLASFGLVTPHKRLEPALAAFAGLRRERPETRFVVCGEVSRHYDLDALLERVGRDGVEITGRLPRAGFEAWMRACDVAVNLRHPTGGETSASLLRLLALGIPTIVTDAGSFAELPDGVVAKVAVDGAETAQLGALFRRLADDGALRRAIGAAARRYVEEHHEIETTARACLRFLAEAPETPPPAAAPPLGRWDGIDPRIALAASLGSDLADLGLPATVSPLLEELAEILAELGWSPVSESPA